MFFLQASSDGPTAMTLEDFLSPFIFYGVCLLIGSVALLLETGAARYSLLAVGTTTTRSDESARWAYTVR
jgi:hypothetical protein